MSEAAFWREVRRLALAFVAAIEEHKLGDEISVTTAEIRSWYKETVTRRLTEQPPSETDRTP